MELLALHQLLEVLQNVAVIVQVTSSAKNEVLGTEQKKKTLYNFRRMARKVTFALINIY